MSGREFLDTNVLIYAHDARDTRKRTCARELIRRLLREQRGVLSLQVLQEFFAAATRKLSMSSEDARRRIMQYSRFDVVTLDTVDLIAAVDLHRLHQVSIWDALIVAGGDQRRLHDPAHRGHAGRLRRRDADAPESVSALTGDAAVRPQDPEVAL